MAAADRLVGRAPVRATLRGALDDARRGAGRVVLLSGESGIGKTALLGWLVDEAGPDALVLRGFCFEGDGAPPYFPWTRVLRGIGRPAEAFGEIAWLVGGGAAPEPDTAAAATDAQFRLSEAVADAIAGQASATRPVVVVLDDLQWADEPSLALLSFLARAAPGHHVLVAGAFREGEGSVRLAQLGTDVQHVPLSGLGLAEVEAVVDAMPGPRPDPPTIRRIWERAGGNPFFVRELTQLVQAYGPDEAPSRLPASVVETVRRRLARLPTDCVQLLDWAAVAGRDIDVELLAAAGAVPDRIRAADLLSEAAHADVVTGTGDVRFTHDIYREAIVAGQPAALNTALNLALGRAVAARAGGAARVASHLLRAGPEARDEAVEYSLRAAHEASARLGHEDACGHYQRALALLDDGDPRRLEAVLALAAAHACAGAPDLARERYRDAAQLSGHRADAAGLARAALGMQSLGQRSGSPGIEVREQLQAADRALSDRPALAALHSRVLAALARVMRHGSYEPPHTDEVIGIAQRAAELAEQAGDPHAVADALLAVHDAMWAPGTAAQRLPVVERMQLAAQTAGDPDLIAQAQLLRATALLELGDPAAPEALFTYVTLAGGLGHARGRWGALTRQATYLAVLGRAEDAARISEEALALGTAIGEPDAFGVFGTHRSTLALLGVPVDLHGFGEIGADPMWPLFPLLNAWPAVVRGDAVAARAALGDFSVRVIPEKYDLEIVAIAGLVFAVAGSAAQRRWAYGRLRPHAGSHAVVGGCAAYQGAVDHLLARLAVSLGDTEAGAGHLRAALAQYERLGAAGFARVASSELAVLVDDAAGANAFWFGDGVWHVDFAGRQVQVADAKGLHDIAALLSSPGAEVHVLDLLGVEGARAGADPVLDDVAKAKYKARLAEITAGLDAADAGGDAQLAAQLTAEQDALLAELRRATGLGGRSRRLGDAGERARKTVGARVRDALGKLDRVHPEFAAHLRESVRLGTSCSYEPADPVDWRVR